MLGPQTINYRNQKRLPIQSCESLTVFSRPGIHSLEFENDFAGALALRGARDCGFDFA